MESNERDRKLDQWLDEALKQYGEAEPRFGLEQRVLAHVRAEQQPRGARWWRWMPAFAAIAAVVVIAIAIRPLWPPQKPAHKSLAESAPAESTDRESRNLPAAGLSGDRDSLAVKKPATVRPQTAKDAPTIATATVADTAAEPSRLNEAPPKEAKIAGNALPSSARVSDGRLGSAVGGVLAPEPARAMQAIAPAPQSGFAIAGQKSSETVRVESAAPMVSVADAPAKNETFVAKKSLAKTEKVNAADAVRADGMGMTLLRTDLAHVAPGPVQQFPTPAPLSNEERAAMAAAKNMKNKPANGERAAGDISTIVIDDIHIAPLAGPEKQ